MLLTFLTNPICKESKIKIITNEKEMNILKTLNFINDYSETYQIEFSEINVLNDITDELKINFWFKNLKCRKINELKLFTNSPNTHENLFDVLNDFKYLKFNILNYKDCEKEQKKIYLFIGEYLYEEENKVYEVVI